MSLPLECEFQESGGHCFAHCYPSYLEQHSAQAGTQNTWCVNAFTVWIDLLTILDPEILFTM